MRDQFISVTTSLIFKDLKVLCRIVINKTSMLMTVRLYLVTAIILLLKLNCFSQSISDLTQVTDFIGNVKSIKIKVGQAGFEDQQIL